MPDALARLLADPPPPELSPGAIVGRLFQVLVAATGSDCAFAYEAVQVGRRIFFGEVQSVGCAGFRAATQGLEGRSLFRYVSPADAPAEEVWPGELNPVGRFGTTGRRAAARLGAWSMLWRPGRIRSTLGMTVLHDGHLIGAIAAVRLHGEDGFGRLETAAARTLEPGIARWLGEAWRRRRARGRPAGARSYLIFDGTGRLCSVSRGASEWLREGDVRGQLGDMARRVLAGEAIAPAFVRRAAVRFEVLDSDRADGRVLVVLEEGGAHRLGPREKLTDAQRRVADLAVAGATVKEIAAGLERSPETVRDHLKAIYERLGIGSRVELGRVLDPPPPSPSQPRPMRGR